MSEKRRKRRFKATFENGGFWEYYKDLEHQFEDFLQYVPYLNVNEGVCSFRLVNLLLSIGGHVDSAFKEMAFYRRFSKDAKCLEIRQKVKETKRRIKRGKGPITVTITDSLSAFEPRYKLSTKIVIFKRLPKRDEIIPFNPYNRKTNAPEWWDIYNGLKHDFSENFEKANLQITRDALAGAFLLNVIHIPAAFLLCHYDLVKSHFEEERFGEPTPDITPSVFLDFLKRKQGYPAFVETPLFIYDYDQ